MVEACFKMEGKKKSVSCLVVRGGKPESERGKKRFEFPCRENGSPKHKIKDLQAPSGEKRMFWRGRGEMVGSPPHKKGRKRSINSTQTVRQKEGRKRGFPSMGEDVWEGRRHVRPLDTSGERILECPPTHHEEKGTLLLGGEGHGGGRKNEGEVCPFVRV